MPPAEFFFVFCSTLFVRYPFLSLFLDYPGFFFVFTVQHTTKISMPPAGFKPVIPSREQPQTIPLQRSLTGISLTVAAHAPSLDSNPQSQQRRNVRSSP
jgi:hypothetical protein